MRPQPQIGYLAIWMLTITMIEANFFPREWKRLPISRRGDIGGGVKPEVMIREIVRLKMLIFWETWKSRISSKILTNTLCDSLAKKLAREYLSEVLSSGALIQQWPSTQMTLFERTRQGAWLDTVTTPVDKRPVNSCVSKLLFFWMSSASKKFAKQTWKCFRWHATNVSSAKFRGAVGDAKMKTAIFCNRALRGFNENMNNFINSKDSESRWLFGSLPCMFYISCAHTHAPMHAHSRLERGDHLGSQDL